MKNVPKVWLRDKFDLTITFGTICYYESFGGNTHAGTCGKAALLINRDGEYERAAPPFDTLDPDGAPVGLDNVPCDR